MPLPKKKLWDSHSVGKILNRLDEQTAEKNKKTFAMYIRLHSCEEKLHTRTRIVCCRMPEKKQEYSSWINCFQLIQICFIECK